MPLSLIRQKAEQAAVRLLLAVIPHLSRPRLLTWADRIGRMAYTCSRHARSVGDANLTVAFGADLTAERRREILQGAFRNFALVALDTFWFSRDTGTRIARWVQFGEEGIAPLLRPVPQICISAHLGNWEVLGMAFSARGFPLISVAAPLDNPGLDRLFLELRNRTGQRIVSKHGALRQLLKALRGHGKVALLLDQNTKPKYGGTYVPFFGLPVAVSTAAAALWRKTGAEIFFGICVPEPDGHYRVPAPVRIPTADLDPAAEGVLDELTRRIAVVTEDHVRNHAPHWLWMYKRWKFMPPAHPRDRYPFYARELPEPTPPGTNETV